MLLRLLSCDKMSQLVALSTHRCRTVRQRYMIQRVGKLPIPSTLRNLRRLPGGSVPLLPFPGVGFRFVTPSCIQGGRFKLPPLPWDGVALSYPTDTTICRTGAAFAICENGAADPLAGSHKFGRARNLKKPKSTVVQTLDNSRAPSAALGWPCGYPWALLARLYPVRPAYRLTLDVDGARSGPV